jgi:hypoxanthine phosphoribosyltransferase
VYLEREAIATRVKELGSAIATDYDGLDPLLVAPLKSSVVFLADLARALPIPHTLDVIELAPYTGGAGSGRAGTGRAGTGRVGTGGAGTSGDDASRGGARLLKDVDVSLGRRHVLLVEDIVDTGLTLHFLCKTFSLRAPASLAAVTLLDRPYRRLVEELPLRYVGFTVPDELYVGYGFDLDERYRNLPDLHVLRPEAGPRAA